MAPQKKGKKHGKKPEPTDPLKQKRFRHNWRTDMLAIPKGHPDEVQAFRFMAGGKDATESEIALKAAASAKPITKKKSKKLIPIEKNPERLKRLQIMSIQPARYYKVQKKLYANQLGKKFETRMNDKIKIATHSFYHEYDQARIAWRKRRRLQKQKQAAGKKGSAKPGKPAPKSRKALAAMRKKRPHAERLREALEWCKTAALPKKIFPPPPVNRGKIADLSSIQERLQKMSRPMHVYKRPSQDSMNLVNRCKVKRGALKYMLTDTIAKMALPLERIIIEPRELGTVSPAALRFKPSERILELAVPKPKPANTDSGDDLEFNKISPYALKYVATPRILELAKPLERD